MNPYPFSFENHFTVPSANGPFPPSTHERRPGFEPSHPAIAASMAAAGSVTSAAREGKPPGLILSGTNRVPKQAGDCHWPDAAGHGREMAGHLPDVFGDVAYDLAFDAVDADVDDGCARLHHVARDHPGTSDGRDDDVRLADDAREVPRSTVAHRHGGVLGEEKKRHRLSDDVRPADNRRSYALQGNLVRT